MDIEGAETKILSGEYLNHFSKFIIALHPQQISAKRFIYLSNILKKQGGHIYGGIFNSKGIAEVIWIKQ